jgi:hypothetical protein
VLIAGSQGESRLLLLHYLLHFRVATFAFFKQRSRRRRWMNNAEESQELFDGDR